MRLKYLRRSLCALAGVLAATSAWADDAKTVTIALEGSFPPWNYTNSDGSLGGFEPALAKVLCKSANMNCKLIAADWDSMIPSLNAEKFDVIMDAMNDTPEREKAIAFTVPYAAVQSAFATSASNATTYANLGTGVVRIGLDEPSDDVHATLAKFRELFKGKTIGIQAATNYVPFVQKNFADICTIKMYKAAQERDLDLESGRIDLTVDNTIYLLGIMKKDNDALRFIGPAIGGTIWGKGVALGLRKSDTELEAAFDQAIKSASADGTIKKLSMQYLGTDVTP